MSANLTENEGSHDKARKVSLVRMRPGQSGKIVQISGGYSMFHKLEAMGIVEGKVITKVSGHWMRGPVLVRANNTQAALGFGMARRIIVQLVNED